MVRELNPKHIVRPCILRAFEVDYDWHYQRRGSYFSPSLVDTNCFWILLNFLCCNFRNVTSCSANLSFILNEPSELPRIPDNYSDTNYSSIFYLIFQRLSKSPCVGTCKFLIETQLHNCCDNICIVTCMRRSYSFIYPLSG